MGYGSSNVVDNLGFLFVFSLIFPVIICSDVQGPGQAGLKISPEKKPGLAWPGKFCQKKAWPGLAW